MSVYTVKQSKVIAFSLILILGIFLLYSLSILFTAILGAVVIYVLFKPLFIYMAEKKKINRTITVVLIILLSIIIIIIPFTGLIWLLTDKVVFYKNHPDVVNKIVDSVVKFVGQTFDQSTVHDTLNKAGTFAVSLITRFLNSALDLLLTFAMMFFFFYFMLKNHEVFEATVVKYIPFRSQNAGHFGTQLKNMTYANVVGQGVIALAQAILLGIGFLIFGLPDPLFWSVVCFFFSFIPVVGSAGVFVPAAIILIASGNTGKAIGLLLYGVFVVSSIDHLLRMIINKLIGDIHPLISITGVIIGIPVFGILGLVFGPFLIALFLLLIRLYEATYLTKSSEKERVVSSEEL